MAYFAGGCVRDQLLGLAPTDYDVATDATPDRIRTLFPRTAEVGAAFGVMLVRQPVEVDGKGGKGYATIEVATFRSEGPYTDRRRPDSVHFSDPRSDAMRRDFTINALFLDPLAERPEATRVVGEAALAATAAGVVIDFVGGLGDLERRVVRAVGNPDERLAEDHLRALRAVRFAARLGFSLDPATVAAVRGHARELMGVSRERIGDELRRMMAHRARAVAAGLLQELALDEPVLGEPHQAPPLRTLAGLEWGGEDVPYPTCLAAWAIDRGIGKMGGTGYTEEEVERIVQRWRTALCLSNEERDALGAVLRGVGALSAGWLSLPVAAQKRAVAAGWFAEALRIVRILSPDEGEQIGRRAGELEHTPSGIRPRPLVDGEDLIGLGLKPGPGFKGVLDRVYDAQLEDRVRTKGEALELARRLGV